MWMFHYPAGCWPGKIGGKGDLSILGCPLKGIPRDLTSKQVMPAGTELGGPKPYEENLNMMRCKMASASPTEC